MRALTCLEVLALLSRVYLHAEPLGAEREVKVWGSPRGMMCKKWQSQHTWTSQGFHLCCPDLPSRRA